jgi:hypothetical protein
MKTLFLFLFLSFFSFSQKIMFEVYKTDLYKSYGKTDLETAIQNYDLITKDIELKEIFIFDLDSSILKINSYPNKESDTKSFNIDCVKKINDSITIKSKINLKSENVYHDFTAYINIDNENSYIYLLFYDEIKNETTFLSVTHFYFEK